jgi:hypothetical protein
VVAVQSADPKTFNDDTNNPPWSESAKMDGMEGFNAKEILAAIFSYTGTL